MDKKGKFIVFEGIDGSGKSTQMKLLGKYLVEKGEQVYLTAEPTDSPFGAQLRACLSGRIQTDEYTIAALFAADRTDHIFHAENGMIKKLKDGVNVLCDRYYFSSLAYNGGFVPPEWILSLNEIAMRELKADLTVFLDVSPEEGMRRVARRGETERYEAIETQQRIRVRYFRLFEEYKKSEKIAVVESGEDKQKTQETIRALADGLFGF